jgi:hypothetical protein
MLRRIRLSGVTVVECLLLLPFKVFEKVAESQEQCLQSWAGRTVVAEQQKYLCHRLAPVHYDCIVD